jgi:hypothetical protein
MNKMLDDVIYYDKIWFMLNNNRTYQTQSVNRVSRHRRARCIRMGVDIGTCFESLM